MLRFLFTFLLLLSVGFAASDIPDPASLPEIVPAGDEPPRHPQEAARRLLAGKALLEQGDVERARVEFDEAFKADFLQPLTYFYQAVAAYRLGDYPLALERANEGRSIVTDILARDTPTPETDAQSARFKELQDAIQKKLTETGGKAGQNPAAKKQEFATAMKEGDEAYGKGLSAKAAAAYACAYRADPTQGEIGLRAASLYADRLKNPFEAARLWQQVLAAGEPHATTARAELQSHRDALDEALRDGLARRDQWRSSGDLAEALRYAEAFPESTELQVALALLFAGKGQVDQLIAHLEAASRLGLSADDFLAEKAFVDYLEKSGGINSPGGLRVSAFVRDAYGEKTLAPISTELKRRADETARLAREKAEKEKQAKLAAERQQLSAKRDAERTNVASFLDSFLSQRNGIEVEVLTVGVDPKTKKYRWTVTRSSSFSLRNGRYVIENPSSDRLVDRKNRVNESSKSQTFTISSFASFTGLDIGPSNWAYDGQNHSSYQAAAPYNTVCRRIELFFRNADVRDQFQNREPDGSYLPAADEMKTNAVIHVMLDAPDVARVKELFTRLGQLDAAGNNVEKLRALGLK